MRIQSFLDLTGNELRNGRLQNLGADPAGLGTSDKGRAWYNTATDKVRVWNGTAAENLTSLVEAVASGTAALGVVTASKIATLTIANATSSQSGLMPNGDKSKLDNAASINTPSALVQRDGSGNFVAGTITAALTGTASNATNLGGQSLAQVRDFSLTTGVRDHNAISDFDAQARTSRLDQFAAPTSDLTVANYRITNLADPTSSQDAANKRYVDSVVSGLDPKASVTWATIAALPAATYANGASGVGATLTANANGALTVDGQSPAVNDRILVKNQVAGAQNGIYVVTQVGSGAAPWILIRATDMDTTAKTTGGAFTFVEGGTTMGQTGWVLAVTSTVVMGTTALPWTQFSGAGTYLAGNGLTLTGSVFSVVGTANRIAVSGSGVDIASTYVGQASITTLGTIATGVWQGTAVAVGYGGTGSGTAVGARANLGATGKAATNVPATAANTPYQFAHNLGTTDVIVALYDLSTTEVVLADFKVVDANNVSVTFGAAVTANAYRLIIIG